jgi:hypothetical protein
MGSRAAIRRLGRVAQEAVQSGLQFTDRRTAPESVRYVHVYPLGSSFSKPGT